MPSKETVSAFIALVEQDKFVEAMEKFFWVFEITGPDGRMLRMDDLAHQTWRGDRIAAERFYFDPGFSKRPVS